MQGGFQHFHYIIGSDLTLFASNHTGTRLIHHRKPSGHQLPAALSLFARCWLNLATLLSVLKAFTAILYCTEIQYLLKHGRRSILFATATASMRAQSGPYLGVLDLTRTERHSSVLCVVWGRTGVIKDPRRDSNPCLDDHEAGPLTITPAGGVFLKSSFKHKMSTRVSKPTTTEGVAVAKMSKRQVRRPTLLEVCRPMCSSMQA